MSAAVRLQRASSASYMEAIDRSVLAGGNDAPGEPDIDDITDSRLGSRSGSLEYDYHDAMLMQGNGTPPAPPDLSTQLAAAKACEAGLARRRLGDMTNRAGGVSGDGDGVGVGAKQELPRWHDQRAEGPACDIMRVESSATAAAKRPDKKSKPVKRWLGIARSSRKMDHRAASRSTLGAGTDGVAAAAQPAPHKSAKLGRRRSFSLRRSKSVGSGDKYREARAATAPAQQQDGFPSPVSVSASSASVGSSSLSFRTGGRPSGEVLFGMDIRVPEQLQSLHRYFLHLGEENIRLEKAEATLSHENTEIIRESEEIKQRWSEVEKRAQSAVEQIHALRAKNDLLEQQVEALKEELDSPTFI